MRGNKSVTLLLVTALATFALCALCVSERMVAQSLPNVRTVFIILMENKDWSQIKGNPSAPYINNQLLPAASHAEAYFTPPGNHPSLPNYLWLEAGDNFGIFDDALPSVNHQSTTAHLVTLLNNAGISWKSYQEDITGTVCPLQDFRQYAPKHNPMVYFDDVTGTNNPSFPYCIAHMRPYTELATDLANGTVAQYNFITPNLCNDMHDCSIAVGDSWLSNEVPRILNSSAYRNGGALFIIWDEGDADSDGPIGMIALSPFAKGNGYSNTIPYTHSSTLRTMQVIFGVRPFLGDAANATDLSDLFNSDFTLSANPSSQTVTAGSSTTYTVTVSPTSGFSGVVTFSASGLPAGASASFSPSSVTGAGSSTLTVTTSGSTPANTYPLAITGTSGSLTRSASVSLTVTAPSNFTVSASPSSRTVTAGSSTTYTATVNVTGGFSGVVTFSASGLPAGAGATFNPPSVTGAGSSTLTVTTSTSLPANTYLLTISGTSGSLTRSTSVSLTVTGSSGQVPRFAYVANYDSTDVWAYTIDTATGALTPVPGSPFAADLGAIAVTVHPAGRFVYVANLDAGNVSAYAINGTTGALNPVPGSPFGADLPWEVTVDPTGRFAYVANGHANNVLGYSINGTTGALTRLPASPFGAGNVTRSVTVDPTGRFVYAANSTDNTISGYRLDSTTGALTPSPGSPYGAGGDPHSVTVDPKGPFVYAENSLSNDVSAYRIDSTTGALTPVPGSPFPAGRYARWVAVDPTGRFVYVANGDNDNVSAYRIDSSTGALTPVPGSPFAAGLHPVSVTVDPTGKFVYAANERSNNVSAYRIDSTTGALTPVPGSPFAAGRSPESVFVTTGP